MLKAIRDWFYWRKSIIKQRDEVADNWTKDQLEDLFIKNQWMTGKGPFMLSSGVWHAAARNGYKPFPFIPLIYAHGKWYRCRPYSRRYWIY